MTPYDKTLKPIWPESKKAKNYPILSKNIEVDVAIVGGGITGISTAYQLTMAGKKVAVVESYQIAKGTTGASTGNLYATVDEKLQTLRSKHNESVLKEVVKSREAGINFIEERVRGFDIDCEFKRIPFYLFTTPDAKAINEQMEKEQATAEKAGLSIEKEAPSGFPFEWERVLKINNQAQFNPLSYTQELAMAIEGPLCQIYENTQVVDVQDGDPCTVKTSNGSIIKARQVIMATHSPKGVYAVHSSMEPYREFAIGAPTNDNLPEEAIYWHQLPDQHYSVRPYRIGNKDYMLALGEAYKVGHTSENEERLMVIKKYLKTHFGISDVDYVWAGQKYRSADSLPYIGKSPVENNVYIATGFAADGLVYGTIAAVVICDLIMGKENYWAKLYNPSRFTPVASAEKFAKANVSFGVQLIKDHLFYGETDELKGIKPGEGKTLKIDNEKLAAYRDEKGKVHLVSSVCPHMGCIVQWNNVEKTWDCPCHASRFAINGDVLEGPAYTGLSQPKASSQTQ